MHNVQDYIITLFARLYVRVGMLLIYGEHLPDRIILLRRGRGHKTSLTQQHFIKVPDQARKVSGHVFVLGYLFDLFLLF